MANLISLPPTSLAVGFQFSWELVTAVFCNFADYDTGFQPLVVVAADFNGDGKTDLATANRADDSVSILFGKGDGTLQPHVDYGVVQQLSGAGRRRF